MPENSLAAVLLPAFLTGLATTAGAVPFLLLPSVTRRTYDSLLGLGAGLMLAAATLGLLSTALADVRAGEHVNLGLLALVLGGFAAGVALLYVMDEWIPHVHAGGHHVHVKGEGHAHHAHDDGHDHSHDQLHDHLHDHLNDHPHAPASTAPAPTDAPAGVRARAQGLMVVGAMSLHRLPEGFAIGAAYAGGGSSLGLTLAFAVAAQNAVEGMVMAAPLKRGGLGGPALCLLITATGMAVPFAAVLGYLFSSHVAGALPPMLALGAGALIYLACNEIIPESHSHGNEVRATFGILAGFVAIILMQALVGHAH